MTDAVASPIPQPRFPWRAYWIALAVIVVIAVAPLAPVYVANQVADANNCVLTTGAVHECRVGGADQGPLLRAMGEAGWYFLVSMPLGGIAFLGWLAILVPHRLGWSGRMRRVRP